MSYKMTVLTSSGILHFGKLCSRTHSMEGPGRHLPSRRTNTHQFCCHLLWDRYNTRKSSRQTERQNPYSFLHPLPFFHRSPRYQRGSTLEKEAKALKAPWWSFFPGVWCQEYLCSGMLSASPGADWLLSPASFPIKYLLLQIFGRLNLTDRKLPRKWSFQLERVWGTASETAIYL